MTLFRHNFAQPYKYEEGTFNILVKRLVNDYTATSKFEVGVNKRNIKFKFGVKKSISDDASYYVQVN